MRSFGTRDHAAEGYVERGFDNYQSAEFDTAMHRFNQAWLLNPENPYVYLGFALLLNKQEHSCEAYDMFKLANEKGIKESGFLADYAHTTSQCATLNEAHEQLDLFTIANKLHQDATQTINERLRAYAYHSWAKSFFLQGDFNNSQRMLDEAKRLGATIDNTLVQALKEKPENQ